MASEAIPTHDEIERQYRTMRLMLDAHGFLRDWYATAGLFFQVTLLVCSVIFCATTFASDDFYLWLHTTPASGRNFRGVVSVGAFAVSLTMLLVDFKGRAALHTAAIECWSRALVDFRRHQPKEGEEWETTCRLCLHDAYWAAEKACAKIPNRQFLKLKAKHLRKIAVSKLKSRHPGCPRLILAVIFRVRDTRGALTELSRAKSETSGHEVRHGDS